MQDFSHCVQIAIQYL